jgi:hypothetical protein
MLLSFFEMCDKSLEYEMLFFAHLLQAAFEGETVL